MLPAEEERLRRALLPIFAATIVGPLAAFACSSGGDDSRDPLSASEDASLRDASVALDASSDLSDTPDAAPLDGFELDVYVDWCEAGAPSLADAALTGEAGCDYAVRSPCGLPLGWRVDGYGTLDGVTCVRMCPVSTNLITGCEVYFGQDVVLDGASLPFDAASIDGGPVDVECNLCGGGGRRHEGYRDARRQRGGDALGAHFAEMARLEGASVPAFLRLARELGAHRAPRSLVVGAARAARDEARHAWTMTALALGHGGVLEAQRPAPFGVRSLEAVAIENAVEGCVRETYGAVVARWQAMSAKDPSIARAMAHIAIDERRHAALAWRVAAWAEARLDAPARERVRDARRQATDRLAHELRRSPAPSLVRLAGLPTANEARMLVDALRRVVDGAVVTRSLRSRNARAERRA